MLILQQVPDKKMRNPSNYKTRFGLYKATIRAMDDLSTVKRAWWVHQAIWHCEQNFPDLLPQLRELIGRPMTLEDLTNLNEVKN